MIHLKIVIACRNLPSWPVFRRVISWGKVRAVVNFDEDSQLWLTEDVVRKFLPVTPQLRREHMHLFPGLTREDCKPDDRFYRYLTGFLNGDLTAVLRFDRAMEKERKRDKSFRARSLKVFVPVFSAPDSAEDLIEKLTDVEQSQSHALELRQLAHFKLRLLLWDAEDLPAAEKLPAETAVASAPVPAVVATPAAAQVALDDWQAGLAELSRLVALGAEPDPDLAQEMVARAQALVALAEAHQAQDQLRRQSAARLAELRLRLEDCLSPEDQAALALPDP